MLYYNTTWLICDFFVLRAKPFWSFLLGVLADGGVASVSDWLFLPPFFLLFFFFSFFFFFNFFFKVYQKIDHLKKIVFVNLFGKRLVYVVGLIYKLLYVV
jgi:hypothetical protein